MRIQRAWFFVSTKYFKPIVFESDFVKKNYQKTSKGLQQKEKGRQKISGDSEYCAAYRFLIHKWNF